MDRTETLHTYRQSPFNRSLLRCLLSAVAVATLSGCEVGRTMFQYNSNGVPWMGIDLMPRRKKDDLHTIRHIDQAASQPARDQQDSPLVLTKQRKSADKSFEKKPIRLNLPPSREALDPTGFKPDAQAKFSVSAMKDRSF